MHYTDLDLTLNIHYCASELNSALFVPSTELVRTANSYFCPFNLDSAVFMHSKDLTLTPNGHYCAFKLHSALFMHSAELAITLMSHQCASYLCLLVLCIGQTLSSLSTISFENGSSNLCFSCIAMTLRSHC